MNGGLRDVPELRRGRAPLRTRARRYARSPLEARRAVRPHRARSALYARRAVRSRPDAGRHGQAAPRLWALSFHGGLGGPQTRAFILAPPDLQGPSAPLVGAVAVHDLLLGWRESVQGVPVTDRSRPSAVADEPS